MFLAVLSGVFIFVISQFILKLILEPVVRLKETFGLISAILLREQANITNYVESVELQSEIRDVSSMLMSKPYAIPFYEYICKIIMLPTKKDLLEVSRSLNFISHCVAPGVKERNEIVDTKMLNHEMKVISEILKIPVSYRDL